MKWISWTFYLSLSVLLSACSHNKEVDLLQSELRTQAHSFAKLENQVEEQNRELVLVRGEAEQLRSHMKDTGISPPPPVPEEASAFLRTTGVRFHSLLTGPLRPGSFKHNVKRNTDSSPQLAAVLVPHDDRGDVVKVPASFEIALKTEQTLSDLTSEPIATWKYDLSEASQHWQRDFLGSGYVFHLPWNESSLKGKYLTAIMTTSDGRIFKTEHRFSSQVYSRQAIIDETDQGLKVPFPIPPLFDENLGEPIAIPPFQAVPPPREIPKPLPLESKAVEESSWMLPEKRDEISTSDRWTEETRPVIR